MKQKDIMDIDFNANKNNFFTNREYDGLKLKKNSACCMKIMRSVMLTF